MDGRRTGLKGKPRRLKNEVGQAHGRRGVYRARLTRGIEVRTYFRTGGKPLQSSFFLKLLSFGEGVCLLSPAMATVQHVIPAEAELRIEVSHSPQARAISTLPPLSLSLCENMTVFSLFAVFTLRPRCRSWRARSSRSRYPPPVSIPAPTLATCLSERAGGDVAFRIFAHLVPAFAPSNHEQLVAGSGEIFGAELSGLAMQLYSNVAVRLVPRPHPGIGNGAP